LVTDDELAKADSLLDQSRTHLVKAIFSENLGQDEGILEVIREDQLLNSSL
jgi:hypothetical protein